MPVAMVDHAACLHLRREHVARPDVADRIDGLLRDVGDDVGHLRRRVQQHLAAAPHATLSPPWPQPESVGLPQAPRVSAHRLGKILMRWRKVQSKSAGNQEF